MTSIAWQDSACERQWLRLLERIGGKRKILIIGSGQTADVTLPTIDLEQCAVISVNESYTEFNSVIHVSVDPHCIDDWYQERLPNEPLWVGRLGIDARHGDGIIEAKELGPLFVPHVGSGCTALMIGWELARRIKGELISVGLDLGIFMKRNGPGHYATFCMRDKARRQDTRKSGWHYQYGPYQKQRKDMARFALFHQAQADAPIITSLSAIRWYTLDEVGKIEKDYDHGIIERTIAWLDWRDSRKEGFNESM